MKRMVTAFLGAFLASSLAAAGMQQTPRNELFVESYFETLGSDNNLASSLRYSEERGGFLVGKDIARQGLFRAVSQSKPLGALFAARNANILSGVGCGLTAARLAGTTYNAVGPSIRVWMILSAITGATALTNLYKGYQGYVNPSSTIGNDVVTCTPVGVVIPGLAAFSWEDLVNVEVVYPATENTKTKMTFYLTEKKSVEWSALAPDLMAPLAAFMNRMIAKVQAGDTQAVSRQHAFDVAYSRAFETDIKTSFLKPVEDAVTRAQGFALGASEPWYKCYANEKFQAGVSAVAAAAALLGAYSSYGTAHFRADFDRVKDFFGVSALVDLGRPTGTASADDEIPDSVKCGTLGAIAVALGAFAASRWYNSKPTANSLACFPAGFIVGGNVFHTWSEISSVEMSNATTVSPKGVKTVAPQTKVVFYLKNGALVRWDSCPTAIATHVKTFVDSLITHYSGAAA